MLRHGFPQQPILNSVGQPVLMALSHFYNTDFLEDVLVNFLPYFNTTYFFHHTKQKFKYNTDMKFNEIKIFFLQQMCFSLGIF